MTLHAITEARRPFWTPAGLAKYLAISTRTMREMLASGVLPSYKIGGSRRIHDDDVNAYLAARKDAAA